MAEEQQATKYINGLKYSIQNHVILHDVFSADEAHNKTLKIEDDKVGLHLSGIQSQLKNQQVVQEFNRVSQLLTDRQPVS